MGQRSFNKYFDIAKFIFALWKELGWKIRINKKKKEKKNAG